MALVYMATNTINNCKYIGQTVRTLQQRKQAHIYKSNVKEPEMVVCRAIKKYGAENFHFEVIRDNMSQEEACQLEIELIAKLQPEYNVSAGGSYHPCGKGGVGRPVVCLTDGIERPSLEAATKKYNLCQKTIRRLCKTGCVDPRPTHERRLAVSRRNGLLRSSV